MVKSIKHLIVGASVFLGVSAIATVPAQALSIKFNSDNIKTYGTSDPITALTDGGNPAATNVELWYSTETPTSNVGFTAKAGAYEVTVSSVTQSDWAAFGQQWFNDLLAAYNVNLGTNNPIYQTALNYLVNNGLPASGDPNIGSFELNESTGDLELALIGHYNLAPLLLSPQTRARYLTGNSTIDQLLLLAAGTSAQSGKPLQMSEIAKVTAGNQTYYAYSFSATNSGITSTDGTESFTGVYRWRKTLEKPPSQSVPEPSAMLGLAMLGGLFAARRKQA